MSTKKKPTITDAMRALLDEESAEVSPESHPSFERLLAYHCNELAEEEEEQVAAHFARCRSCTEQSVELAQFLGPEPDQAPADPERLRRLTPFEAEAGWRKLRGRLPRERPRLRQPWAAVLLVALGLSVFLLLRSVQRQPAHRVEPNVPIVTLDATVLRREAGQPPPPPAPVPAGAVLVLLPEQAPADAAHTLEILTAAGARIDSAEGLRPTEQGQFHLRLPPTLTPGAEYRIRILYPGQDHAEELLLRIATPAAR